jgi:hypothetical protein
VNVAKFQMIISALSTSPGNSTFLQLISHKLNSWALMLKYVLKEVNLNSMVLKRRNWNS